MMTEVIVGIVLAAFILFAGAEVERIDFGKTSRG